MTEEMNTNPSVSEADAEIMTAAAAEMHASSEAGENAATVEAARAAHPLRVDEIKEIIPHRYPFLLIDQVVDYEPGKFADARKCVTVNEPFFQGHFPQEPVMPGVLLVEAMAQTGGMLVLSTVDDPERYSTYFMKIDNVKFRQKVVPGDTLIFHVSFLTELRRGCAMMKGRAFIGEKLVCECEFMAQIIKNK